MRKHAAVEREKTSQHCMFEPDVQETPLKAQTLTEAD